MDKLNVTLKSNQSSNEAPAYKKESKTKYTQSELNLLPTYTLNNRAAKVESADNETEEPRIKIVETEEEIEEHSINEEAEGRGNIDRDRETSKSSILPQNFDWAKYESQKTRTLRDLVAVKIGEIYDKRPDEAKNIVNNILTYKEQMQNNGYNELYSLRVCDSMLDLYEANIDSCIPKSLTEYDNKYNPQSSTNQGSKYAFPNFDLAYNVIYHPEAKEMRSKFNSVLKKVTQEKNINYDHMLKYFMEHQDSSWNESGRLLKGVSLSQKGDDTADKYYLGEKKSDENKRDSLVELARSNPYFEGITRAIAMYQASVGIALNHIEDIPGLNREKGTLTLYREIKKYDDQRWLGILDSTSMGDIWGISRDNPNSYYVLKAEVPITNVKIAYFLSPELCEDGLEGGLGNKTSTFAREREIIADLGHAKVEILDKPSK